MLIAYTILMCLSPVVGFLVIKCFESIWSYLNQPRPTWNRKATIAAEVIFGGRFSLPTFGGYAQVVAMRY